MDRPGALGLADAMGETMNPVARVILGACHTADVTLESLTWGDPGWFNIPPDDMLLEGYRCPVLFNVRVSCELGYREGVIVLERLDLDIPERVYDAAFAFAVDWTDDLDFGGERTA